MAKKKQPLAIQKWLRDHPNDAPCPTMPAAAREWRRARGLDLKWAAKVARDRARYEAAMAETRAAGMSPPADRASAPPTRERPVLRVIEGGLSKN